MLGIDLELPFGVGPALGAAIARPVPIRIFDRGEGANRHFHVAEWTHDMRGALDQLRDVGSIRHARTLK
jgi:hypothetical protein